MEKTEIFALEIEYVLSQIFMGHDEIPWNVIGMMGAWFYFLWRSKISLLALWKVFWLGYKLLIRFWNDGNVVSKISKNWSNYYWEGNLKQLGRYDRVYKYVDMSFFGNCIFTLKWYKIQHKISLPSLFVTHKYFLGIIVQCQWSSISW
jgi:hypothetical protein